VRVLVLILLALGCGDDEKTDASVLLDAGDDAADAADGSVADALDAPTLDAPPDVFDGGPDTRDVFETPPWRHEPRIETHDMTPCDEWDYVVRAPRALPADSTPRTLWRYRPSRDPLYNINAQNQTIVRQPVVSPDGTIWVHGPRPSHITQLTREGRMRRWWSVGGTDGFDPDNPTRLGPLMTLPDGRAIAVIYSVDPEFTRGSLNRIDPARPFRSAASRRDDGGVRIDELSVNTQLAAGPGGMVYAAAGHRLHATCKGERLMWTLINESTRGEPEGTGRLSGPIVEADGTLQVSGVQRLYRIAPNSIDIETTQPVAMEPGESMSIAAQTPSWKLLSIAGNNSSRIVLHGSENDVHYDNIVSGVGLSPNLDVLFGQAAQAWFVQPPYLEMQAVPFGQQYSFTARWLDSGDWLAPRVVMGLSRNTGAGEIVWTVDPAEGDDAWISDLAPVFDQQGVFYASMMVVGNSIELVAIQTDGLPPPLSMCVDQTCNAFRDRWMRPEDVAE